MIYDIIMIGGGPAGLTAAIYARRAGKSALVIEKAAFGGQITYSPKVENIPGFESVTGNEFADALVSQALSQGVEIEVGEVTEIKDGLQKTVVTDSGEFSAYAVVIATGAKHRRLGLEGEEELIGQGISFCAVCDGAFFAGKRVAVIGGGNSALQEAIQLSQVASHVTVVQNLDFLTGEKMLEQTLREKENVEIVTAKTVCGLVGDGELESIILRDEHDGTETRLDVDGMFVAIGLIPQNEPFSGIITLDSRGYADYSEECTTERAGIFVAGDCRRKGVRQVTTAAADGAVAALAACAYVEGLSK